jgi:hypothetical protein
VFVRLEKSCVIVNAFLADLHLTRL